MMAGKPLLQWSLVVLVAMSFVSLKQTNAFHVAKHLSTKTAYENLTAPVGGSHLNSVRDPEGCRPVLFYLVSRHGSRFPTGKKMRLGASMRTLISQSRNPAFSSWRYVFAGETHLAGELHRIGAQELNAIGKRYAARFPDLFNPEYDGSPFPSSTTLVRATQKPRASATAVAFMHGVSDLSFSITMNPLKDDPLLRFFDVCPAYEIFKDEAAYCMAPFKKEVLGEMVEAVSERLQLERKLKPSEVGDLWALCQMEAMLGRTDWACSLFTAEDVLLLEWLDDLEALEEKAYGSCLSYQMAMPLFNDTLTSLSEAALDSIDGGFPVRRAVLNFAHAETVVPYSSILGLFGSPGPCSLKSCESLQGFTSAACGGGYKPKLPRPPAERIWRGSTVAPMAAHVAHVLYHCPKDPASKHVVRTFYNEYAVPLPGCGGKVDCPLQEFQALHGDVTEAEVWNACSRWDVCAAMATHEEL